MTRWTDEAGAREYCPVTRTVRVVPWPEIDAKRPLYAAEHVAFEDLTRHREPAHLTVTTP